MAQAFSNLIFTPVLHQITQTANVESLSKPLGQSTEPTASRELMIRINEIKSVTKSLLTLQERKELRPDLGLVNNQLGEPGAVGGIWVSIMSLMIVIALILILIL